MMVSLNRFSVDLLQSLDTEQCKILLNDIWLKCFFSPCFPITLVLARCLNLFLEQLHLNLCWLLFWYLQDTFTVSLAHAVVSVEQQKGHKNCTALSCLRASSSQQKWHACYVQCYIQRSWFWLAALPVDSCNKRDHYAEGVGRYPTRAHHCW